MFNDYYLEKIIKQVDSLNHLRYRDVRVIKEFRAAEEPGNYRYADNAVFSEYSKKMSLGDFWSGRDKYFWLNCSLTIPGEWKNEDAVGVFCFGLQMGGHSSGFESMVFVNGKPYQGLDRNHNEVFLKQFTGQSLSLDFRLWSGLEGGGAKAVQHHQISKAFIAILDHPTDELFYLLRNMTDTIKLLSLNDPARYRTESILTEGYNYLDFTEPGSEQFRDSVKNTLDFYNNTLKNAKNKNDVRINFIGHTHIDLAYKWRYRHTVEKAERSFSTVLRLMEKYPEYIFLQSQAQLYDSIKKEHPTLYDEIKKKIAQEQWEASGSMWVESDCNIPSGESLVRQILYGKIFFRNEFGAENTFLWLPDVFGFSWALPQILKKSGIDTIITSKLSWNENDRMPSDTFIWVGMDGTQILTYFITTPDENGGSYYTYNGVIEPWTTKGVWDNYKDKGLNRELLFSFGFGDGGGGANRTMLENLRAISKIPGLPEVKTTRVNDYLNNLHKRIKSLKENRLLHFWEKELYLQFHRGTYTSQAYVKYMNRRLELMYRNAEILQTMAAFRNQKWETDEKLHTGWKLILKNQFHDIIPGSSINEVYKDTKEEYEEAYKFGKETIQSAVSQLCVREKNFYSVINTAAWNRCGIVRLEGIKQETVINGPNGILQTQLSDFEGSKNLYVYADSIKPMSMLNISLGPKTKNEHDDEKKPRYFKAGINSIETPFYRIKWNKTGQLTSIYDKETNREALKGPGNLLQIFEDRPRRNDAWEIEANTEYKREDVTALESVIIAEQGALFARIHFVWLYNKSRISQDLMLYSMHKRIDFRTAVDWLERSKLLKTSFTVDVRSVSARYDIQFGSLERPTHRSTSWDASQFEVAGHQWADLSETYFGVSLMNDSKYGYSVHGNVMGLSLLKSAEFPDTEADCGFHQFVYSLYIHKEPWFNSEIIGLAWDLNDPLIAAEGKAAFGQFMEITSPGMVIDAFKKSENNNDAILRLHESRGGKTSLKISFNIPIKGWVETDLMENLSGNFMKGNKPIIRKVNPFEIVTFRISF